MLSYKQWKTVNESVMGGGCLGVSNPNSLGVMSKFGLIEMAKKKSKKKMDFDMEDEDETGDGEVVDAASEKDEPEIDVDDAGGEEHEGGCNMCGKNSKKKSAKKSAKKSLKKSKKKMWGDDDDAAPEEEEGDEDMGGEEDEDLEAAEEESGEDLDGDNEEGEGDDHIAKMKAAKGKAHTALAMGGGEDEAPMFSKKKSSKKSEKKSEKKMQKEEVSPEDTDWWNSVKNMLGAPVEQKFDDGWTQYHDPLEPLPGEVGFAPQGRMN